MPSGVPRAASFSMDTASVSGGYPMNGLKAFGALLGIGAIATTVYLLVRKRPSAPGAPLWKIGDVLWCYAGGDSGPFTIMDRREGAYFWQYHIGEGSPPIDDLGWVTERDLLEMPWSCSL